MCCNRSSSVMFPLSISAFRLAIAFREAWSLFGAARAVVVENGREACVICMRVSPGCEEAHAAAVQIRRSNFNRNDPHLTFVLFAGPTKERIHLGAAIVAVVSR